MAKKIFNFVPCVKMNNGFVPRTNRGDEPYGSVPNATVAVPSAYKNDTLLDGKVEGIVGGYQKWVAPFSGVAKITVRGASGGLITNDDPNNRVDPYTGQTTGYVRKPGRGAKLVGKLKVKKGEVFYLAVGLRGLSKAYTDWGAGGGGASVLMRRTVNPTYHLAPAGEAVEVLMVAGGGGGTGDGDNGYTCSPEWSSNGEGGDAHLENGADTGPGVRHVQPAPGSGLEARDSGGYSSESILGGGIASHWGGFPAGGGSYNGGGGGAGYKGGSAMDCSGGEGGWSYINPAFVKEVSRGYPTIEEDRNTGVENPYTAYGHIQIEISRNETKLILAKDNEGYKWFDGTDNVFGDEFPSATGRWLPISPQPSALTDTIYQNYGTRLIDSSEGLVGDNVKLFIRSEENEEDVYLDGLVKNTIVEMKQGISFEDLKTIKRIDTLLPSRDDPVDFWFIATGDTKDNNGKLIWYTVEQVYDSSNDKYEYEWTQLDNDNIDTIKEKGLTKQFERDVPVGIFQQFPHPTMRFKFLLNQQIELTHTGERTKYPQLRKLNVLGDMLPTWVNCGTDIANYEFAPGGDVNITFKKAGNFKVNYVDEEH